MVRHAPELEKHPLFHVNDKNIAPVSRGIDNLTTEEGNRLEEMARISSPEMVRSAYIGYIFANIYGSKYVGDRVSQNFRLSIGHTGLGRREIIDIVEAGGSLPPEYYTNQSRKFKITDSGSNE